MLFNAVFSVSKREREKQILCLRSLCDYAWRAWKNATRLRPRLLVEVSLYRDILNFCFIGDNKIDKHCCVSLCVKLLY